MANGLSGDDTIIGTSSNEHLNGGAGEDTILAGLGDDRINGGSGDDVLDGEAGSDTVRGDSGDDQLIYRASENVGATDIYDGGSGQDTLRLELTLAEWLNPSLQLDMANYLAFVAANTLPNGQANNSEFRFTAFDLRVSKLENLEVVVDGVVIDPQDQPVTLTNDAITTNEDSASLAINLLANDSVPDLVQSLAIASPPTQGTLQLALDLSDPFNPIANAVYTPGVALQALAVGETATDTFTYTVTDADGDSQGATVTVTITGTNDGPVITAGATASHIEEPDTTGALPAYASSGVLDFADVDLSDTHTVDVGLASLTWSGDPVVPAATAAALATALSASLAADSTGSGSGNIDWQFDLSNQLVDFLAEGETLTAIYEVTVTDNHGASATQPVTISFTGTNDVPVIAGGDTAGTVQEDGPVIQATGQLDVADPDHNAAHTWTVVGGTASGNADYLFGADSLTIYRGTPANLLFHDDFGDGNPPPDSPDFTNGNPHTYGGVGANGFSETGGRLIFDSDDAVTLIGVGTPDPFVGQNAIVRSFIDTVVPGGPVGLRSGTNFTVEGVFDLVLPDSPREAYGIRLTDRLIGGDGSPPDQQGDEASSSSASRAPTTIRSSVRSSSAAA